MPHGGYKQSGYGKDMSKYALEDYTEVKHVMMNLETRVAPVAEYRFLTTWLLGAPRERAWELLERPLEWPRWWRGVVRVEERAPGDRCRVGSRYRVEWRSRIPYSIEFDFTVERGRGAGADVGARRGRPRAGTAAGACSRTAA